MGLFFHLISAAESCSMFRGKSRKAMINNFRYFNYFSPISSTWDCFSRSSISSSPFSTCSTKIKTPSYSSSSPWLMLPPSFDQEVGMKYNFYSPGENKVLSFNKKNPADCDRGEEIPDDESEIVGSSHGWLALFNPTNSDLFLSNPLTRRHIKLPSIHSLGIPSEYLNLECCITKIIISCDDPESPECRALMIFAPTSRLAFCSPLTSTHWTPLGQHYLFDFDCARGYDEFVYDTMRKLFYCISHSEIEGWDIISDQQNPRMDWASHSDRDNDTNLLTDNLPRGFLWASQFIYLIAYSNQLFLVCRDYVGEMAPDGSEVERSKVGEDYPYKTVDFRVYRIDREGQKLSYMEKGSLDGMVMFVGLNHSFALSASEHPGLKPNSIYFSDVHIFTRPKFIETAYGGHDIGIFDYENKTISPCYYPCDVQSFKRIMPAPLWYTPSFVA